LGFNPCRPTSTGRIDIASPDPAQPPRIQPNYLGTAADVAGVLAGARLIGGLQQTPALRGLILGAPAVDPAGLTDDALLADFRARSDTPMNQPYLAARRPRMPWITEDTKEAIHGVVPGSNAAPQGAATVVNVKPSAGTIFLADISHEEARKALAAAGR
jgi:choline dehydrogenase